MHPAPHDRPQTATGDLAGLSTAAITALLTERYPGWTIWFSARSPTAAPSRQTRNQVLSVVAYTPARLRQRIEEQERRDPAPPRRR